MANGELGEARARALLLQRFYVLDRSIDKDGADFLIQLKSEGKFSDLAAPRLGIVQVKFCENSDTSHYIPIDYVLDNGRLIKEFFVLITEGFEEKKINYFLTSSDLSTLLKVDKKGKICYSLTHKNRLPFKKGSESEILDDIHDRISERNEEQNNLIYKSINILDFNFDTTSLHYEWILPIPNEFGVITDLIYKARMKIKPQVYELDNFSINSSVLLTSDDVNKCIISIDNIINDENYITNSKDVFIRIGSFGYGAEDMFKIQRELKSAADVHIRRIGSLRKRGLLDKFLEINNAVIESHEKFINDILSPLAASGDSRDRIPFDIPAQTKIKLKDNSFEIENISTDFIFDKTKLEISNNFLVSCNKEIIKKVLTEGTGYALREIIRIRYDIMKYIFNIMCPDQKCTNSKEIIYIG